MKLPLNGEEPNLLMEVEFEDFATVEEVEARYRRPLTDADKALAQYVITTVTGLIGEVAGVGPAALDPVPFYFKVLCVEKAISALANPGNVASQSETIGSYSYSESFPKTLDSAAFLSDDEELKVRRIARNQASGSTRVKSLLHDTIVREPQS